MKSSLLDWLRRFLRLNYYDDSVSNVRANILNVLLLTALAGMSLMVILSLVAWWIDPTTEHSMFAVLDLIAFGLLWLMRQLNKAGHSQLASSGFLFFGALLVSALLVIGQTDNVLVLYLFLTVIASFILAPIASLVILCVTGLSYLAAVYFLNIYDHHINFISILVWFVVAVCAWLIARELERSLEIARAAAMQLEQRVQERTAELLAANLALRASEERLHQVFAASEDGFWDWNAQTNQVAHSPRYAAMLGYSLDQISAEFGAWRARVHPDDLPLTAQAWQDHQAGLVPQYVCEYRQRTRTGEWLWVLDRGKFVERDAQGQVVRMVGVQTDITARKQIEKALRESEERLQLMFDATQDGFWDWDMEAGTSVRSQGYAAMLGYTLEQLDAESPRWHPRIHPDDYAQANQAFDDHLAGLTPIYTTEHRQRTRTGEWLWVLDRGKVIKRDATGKPLRTVGVQSDITARKHAEEVLRQQTQELAIANAELAKANRLKDEFLANMSHELRTPLNTILGMTETLRENVYGALRPEQDRALGHVAESGKHLLSLINDILDLSKIEAGKVELDRAPVALESLCQASLRFVKQLAQKNKIQVHFETNVTDVYLQADERRLKQALVNLLSNAVKFTFPGGTIGLQVNALAEQHAVELTVWDTGIGIAPADQARLFQPFVQVDSRLARQYEGAGLGLALVSQIAQLHSGKVTLESALGKGSRFTITLPWDGRTSFGDERAHVGTPTRSNWQATDSPLILLADDNQTTCQWLGDFLQSKLFRVAFAEDGARAVQTANTLLPDLVLIDIQMPNLDGLAAIRQICANPALAVTPIIALTALAMPGDAERCLQAGANAYLAKPVVLHDLVEMIQTWLKGRS